MLPRWAQQELAAGETLVGLVVALAPICSVAGSVLAGPQVDRRGRRLVALAGLAIAIAGALLLVVAPPSTAVTLLSRGTLGFGAGAAATAIMTWVLDTVPPERRARAIGIVGIAVWIGLAVGPQLGQVLLDEAGYGAVWVAVVAIEAIAVLLILGGREVARAPASRDHAERRIRRLVPRGAVRPSAAIALAAYGEGVMMAFLVLHLVEQGVNDGAGFGGAASVFTIFAVSVLAFRLPGSWLLDRADPRRVVIVALAFEAAALALLAVASSFAVAAIGAAMMGTAFSVLFPGLAVLAAASARADRRGAALGTFGASFSLGVALGSLVGGGVAALGGGGAAHLSGSLAAVGAVLVLARWRHRRSRLDPELV